MISKASTYQFIEGFNIADLMDSQEMGRVIMNDYSGQEPERRLSEIFESNTSENDAFN